MDLITPDIGLLFWMLVSFGILLFLLKKYAWLPILKALKEREDSIEQSLQNARKAREELALLKVKGEEILNAAKEGRDVIIKEAKDAKDKVIAEAKQKAKQEADNILKSARESISNEKKSAMAEIKNQVASLSVEIAEKILKNELSEDKKQKALVENLLDEIKLN